MSKLILSGIFLASLLVNQADGALAPATLNEAPDRHPQKLVEPTIRVRVAQALEEVVVSGTDLMRKLHPTDDLKSFSGRKSIRFNCRGFAEKNQQNPELARPILLASLVSQTGLLSLSDERFAGKLKVVRGEQERESCDVIHVTTMEDYIATLLAKEMNAEWPMEALKAQAIAARTYAYHKIMTSKNIDEKLYDLESSERHQVSGSFFDATTRTLEATRATRGIILKTKDGRLTEAFFHAKCGGRTLVPERVWSHPVAGYQAVRDPYCKGRGNLNTWTSEVERERFIKFLLWAKEKKHIRFNGQLEGHQSLLMVTDQADNNTLRLYLNGEIATFNKSLLRRYFGGVLFSSNHFLATWTGEKLIVRGEGKGHGVGMCQIGALGMAGKGKDFKEILSHYYPEHRLEKIY